MASRYPVPPPPPGSFGSYASSGPDPMLQLIMQRGQIEADAAQRSGALWGGVVGNVTQIGTDYLKQQEEEQKKKADAAKLATRDAAWVKFVEGGEWAQDPKLAVAGSMRLWGPEKGPAMAQGLLAFKDMSTKGDEADAKRLGVLLQATEGMSDPVMARFYPALREKAAPTLQKLGIPSEVLPGEWTPEARKGMSALSAAFRGEKPAAPKGLTEVSPGASLFDPETRQPVFTAPTAEKPQEPRVVGRSLVGPDGKVIYRDPAEPRQNDGEPLVAIMGPDGNPVLVPRSQAQGKRPASNREQGRPVTSGDAGKIADLDTSLNDLGTLRGALQGNHATGMSARIGAWLGNPITEATGIGTEAKQKQAVIDRVKQVIGKTLEGGVLRKEDEAKYEKILPAIGDPPEVAAAKLKGLEQAIQLRRQTTFEALADAGYDVSRFQARTPVGTAPAAGPARISSDADYAALPSGAEFIAPDGSHRRKP